jgi:hypothetical protein
MGFQTVKGKREIQFLESISCGRCAASDSRASVKGTHDEQ